MAVERSLSHLADFFSTSCSFLAAALLTWTSSRECIRNDFSILYMTPKPVVDYIIAHRLFLPHHKDQKRECSTDD